MHIQRINGIKNYRIFQDFKTPSSSVPWQPITVVYGPNGSGKSTLSSLFSELAEGTASGSGITADLFRRQNVVNTINETDSVWSNLRVFNQSYVQENLKFETSADGSSVSAKHLLTLGGNRIKVESRLEEIRKRQSEIAEELTKHTRTHGHETKKRDAILTGVAQSIGRELGHTDGRFNPRSYNAPKARALIEKGKTVLTNASSTNITDDEAQIKSHALPKIDWVSGTCEDATLLVSQVNTLRAMTVTSLIIEELAANKQTADWVQAGLPLHKDTHTCLFCEGELRDERRTALESHFDDSFRALQTEVQRLRTLIATIRTNIDSTFGSIPKKTTFYSTFHDAHNIAIEAVKQRRKDFLTILTQLEIAIREKEDSPFSVLDLVTSPEMTMFAFREIDDVVAKSNAQTAAFGDTILAAALRLEASRVLECFEGYTQASNDVDGESRTLKELRDENKTLTDEEQLLATTDLDPLPKAQRLNRDLAILLGRSEISFKPVGEQYEILRGDKAATGLSEGERNAISLLYFLCALEKHEDQGKDLIVIIDDPVSSFDDNILFGASAHLWSRLVESDPCHQLIIFTHSFNFFRTWSNQLDHRQKKSKTKKPHTLKELSTTLQPTGDGLFRRQPHFVDWPDDNDLRIRLRSEYHYLFWTLGKTLTDAAQATDPLAQSTAAAIMPNAARRLLESFLAFKRPATMGNFESSVTAAMDGVDEAVRIRMIKFLHRFSHNEQGDVDASIRPEESLPVLASVFSLIHSRDKEHFDETCTSLGLDGAFLLQIASIGDFPSDPDTTSA